jgi:hypothetical protein
MDHASSGEEEKLDRKWAQELWTTARTDARFQNGRMLGSHNASFLAVATVYYMNCCPKTIALLLAFWVMCYMMVMFHCIVYVT